MQRIYISGSIGYDEIMDFPNHFKDYFHPEKLHQINVSFAVDSLARHLGGCATNIAYALRNTVDYYSRVIPSEEGIQSKIYNAKSSNYSLDSRLLTKGQSPFGRCGNDPSAKFTVSLSNCSGQAIISPVGAVGKDGEQLIEFFKNNNIDTTHILQDKKLYTATGRVITDKNDNQIWGFYYGASALDIKFLNKKSDYGLDSRLRGNDKESSNEKMGQGPKSEREFWILTATHERPFTTALKYVINNKLPYLFDPGMTLTWIRDDLLKKGVLSAAYLIGNDYEIAMIEKRLKMTVEEMVKKGVNVITTLGEKGVRYEGVVIPAEAGIQSINFNSKNGNCPLDSRLLTKGQSPFGRRGNDNSISIPAVKLKNVVDPTGAGDAWRGGFVGALVSGKDIKECLIMGNVMASFAVEYVGTVEYIPKREEIEKRMKSLSKQKL